MMRDKKKKGKNGIFKINLKSKESGTPSLSSWNSQHNKSEKGQEIEKNRDDISINTALYKEFGVVTTSELP